jgi:hypothetical protein
MPGRRNVVVAKSSSSRTLERIPNLFSTKRLNAGDISDLANILKKYRINPDVRR